MFNILKLQREKALCFRINVKIIKKTKKNFFITLFLNCYSKLIDENYFDACFIKKRWKTDFVEKCLWTWIYVNFDKINGQRTIKLCSRYLCQQNTQKWTCKSWTFWNWKCQLVCIDKWIRYCCRYNSWYWISWFCCEKNTQRNTLKIFCIIQNRRCTRLQLWSESQISRIGHNGQKISRS